MKTRTNGQQTHQPHASAEPPSRSQHRPRSACRVSSLAWALLRIFQTPPFFPRLSPFLQPLPIAAAPPDAAPPIQELIPPHQAPLTPFIDAALSAAQMAPAQRRRPRSDSQDSDSLLPAAAAPPLRCPPTPPSARHRRNELPDASAVTVRKAQGTSFAFFAIFGEKELAPYAFNRPVWNRPQGPHDAQAPHRAFIVRSSSKCDAGSIATLRTARAACPAHDAPRAAELDGAIAADEAELTLAQAALKLRMRPRLQQRPSRSRLRALRCPLHRDAASDSSNFGLDTGHVVVLWHACVSLTCVSVTDASIPAGVPAYH